MDTIAFAKKYIQTGWAVFPCAPHEKYPLFPAAHEKGNPCRGECGRLGHGLYDATLEENLAVGWFEINPSANIGIACGKKTGIAVLDIDPKHGGFESIQELQSKFGKLPDTVVAKTGGGGEHILFRYPKLELRNSTGKLGLGLDIRAEGGFIVAAPSIHPSGNVYEWICKPSQTQLAEMPNWMLEALYEPVSKPQIISTIGMIPDGQKHDYFVKRAGSMRRIGFDSESIYQALMVENNTRCINPAPAEHILEIAQDIAQRYQPKDEPKLQIIPQITDPFFAIDKLEANAKSREADPRDVWGIHYAWPYLSLITGGKQPGELIYIGGEPGVGKSFWVHQDAMWTAIGKPSENIPPVPTFLWSGEMPPVQVYRRMFEMLGVPKRAMLSGKNMGQCWQAFNEAKAILVNSPLYVSDAPLDISNVRTLLEREIGEHGIEQACFDYDWLIGSKGSNEIETSQNISRTFKILARELNISIVLISSVNKGGMDTTAQVTKSNLSGSGKKIHDGDIVYILSKLNENKVPLSVVGKYKPDEYWKIVVLNIEKGRDLDYHVPDKKLLYARETPKPSFTEISKPPNKNMYSDILLDAYA